MKIVNETTWGAKREDAIIGEEEKHALLPTYSTTPCYLLFREMAQTVKFHL
jgi:hypothetical protein